MLFNKAKINQLLPTPKTIRQTIKTESIMIEQQSDSLSFYFKFKSPTSGKIRIKKLGSFSYGSVSAKDVANIRNEVTTLKSIVISGKDPLDTQKDIKAKQSIELNYQQLWKMYVESVPFEQKSEQTKIAYTNSAKKILERFKKQSLNTITKKALQDFVYTLPGGRGKLVIAVLNILEDIYIDSQELGTDVVSTRTYKLQHNPMKKRTRTLTEDQIKDLFSHAGTIPLILQFQLMTGCRISEVLLADWSEIDFQQNVWVIPPSHIKTERLSKNADRPHILPLSNMAIELLLKASIETGRSGLIFKTVFGRHLTICSVNIWLKGYGISSHDIRRTTGSWLSANSSVPDALTILLNHKKSTGADASYDHSQYMKKKGIIIDEWHSYLKSLTV